MNAQENEEKALVLHTLPTVARTKSKENERIEVDTGNGSELQASPEPRQRTDVVDQDQEKRRLSVSTTTIPRLISVVEIIKREYLVAMNAKRSLDLVGLYQYNEMGSLEDQVGNERREGEESAEDRATMITEALNGTKGYVQSIRLKICAVLKRVASVKVARSPYMKITLCRKELTGMKERGAT